MIQFNTLIYLFMAIFSLEFSKQNVNLLVKRAACGSVRKSLGQTPFFLFVQMALLTQAGCILNLMHVLILYLLRTSESLCITVIILLHEKFLQSDWLRAVVFQLNLKYLHVKITNLLWEVV